MSDFTITERTEPFTLEEVFNFIDDTNISKADAHELKSRIVNVVQAERNMVIDEFAKEIRDWQVDIQDNEYDANKFDFVFERIYEIAEELKGGGE